MEQASAAAPGTKTAKFGIGEIVSRRIMAHRVMRRSTLMR
jgi:hypothetical protein